MPKPNAPRVAFGPAAAPDVLTAAVEAGGGEVVPIADAEALVWLNGRDPDGLTAALDEGDGITWVQLPQAGIEHFATALDAKHTWTCMKGAFADPCAEMALSLSLAGMRHVGAYARQRTWTEGVGRSLLGARVTVLGGGGVAQALLRLLEPFDCHVTVVRNHVQDMEGADVVVEADRYADCLPGADLVVLALALTPETDGLISREELQMMEPHAWIVNVARGQHIVTDDLVWALQERIIGGAALDVTEPEPLPDDHPLWSLDNCIITPHTANTAEMGLPLVSRRITENVRLFAAGEELIGLVDVERGY
jgi:phosphoglycerate dehydrogenase-like enzyme